MTASDDRPMTVMVEFQVRSESTSVDAWLDEWAIRAHDAAIGEPATSAYAAAVNVDADDQILVFERYRNGESSLKAHVDRPAHAALNETMGTRGMTRRRVMSSRFHDQPDFGWWSRSDGDIASPEGALVVFVGFRFDDEEHRSTFLEMSGEHANYCWEHEPGTLIYSTGVALADADRELDQERGDTVFVMVCSDPDAAEQHANDPRHLALVEEMERLGIGAEPTFRRTYRTTGHGYIWKP